MSALLLCRSRFETVLGGPQIVLLKGQKCSVKVKDGIHQDGKLILSQPGVLWLRSLFKFVCQFDYLQVETLF